MDDCDFASFSTVFQSYQDDERLIMKGCVQWNSVSVEKILPRAGIKLGPLNQYASAQPTELPGLRQQGNMYTIFIHGTSRLQQ